MLVCAVLCLVLCAGCQRSGIGATVSADAGPLSVPDELTPVNRDYELLRDSTVFADGPVGYAAQIPDEVNAFARLYRDESALLYFTQLSEEGSLAGKLYAMCGLYDLDPEQYQALVEQYCLSNTTVRAQFGCIVFDEAMSKIIENCFADGSSPQNIRTIMQDIPEET